MYYIIRKKYGTNELEILTNWDRKEKLNQRVKELRLHYPIDKILVLELKKEFKSYFSEN